MHAGRWSIKLAALVCLAMAQCTLPPPAPLQATFANVPSALKIDPDFQFGLGRLAQRQPWPHARSNARDWVLLGVKVECEGAEHVWFVRVAESIDAEEAAGGRALADRRFTYALPFGVGAIRAKADYSVACRRIRIETYDHRGNALAAWSRLAPEVFPDSSLFDVLAALPERGPMRTEHLPGILHRNDRDLARLKDEGLYEMVATLQALGTTPPLLPIRDLVKKHVVEIPSLLNLLLTGLKPTLTTSLAYATPTAFPWALDQSTTTCYQSEFATALAGERFFNCRVVAGPSLPPCDLVGGLLVIEVAHPERPENRLTVRVLAASRGAPDATLASATTGD